MKKTVAAVFAAALVILTAVSIGGCTSSENSESIASMPENTSVTSQQSTAYSAPITTSPKVKPTGASDKEQLSDEVIKAALDYCKMSRDYRDCVKLNKNEMAHDGSFYHFVYVEKDDTVIPLVISYDAKTVYEPSDFFAKYGTVEEATTEKSGDSHRSRNSEESSDNEEYNDDYEEYYDEDYYY